MDFPTTRPTPRRGPSLLWPAAVLALLAFVLYREGGRLLRRSPEPAAAARPVTPRGDLAADEKSTIELFRRCSPSVVYITSIVRGRVGWFEVSDVPQGTGSGFVWDGAGHVVTNFHVIQGATRWQVTLSDGSSWKGTLVGSAPDKDLAVLRIAVEGQRLVPIMVGSSRDLQVGQRVFAIGNPFGLDQSLTTGIVSALGRTIQSVTDRKIEGVIQTDAAINPGNSGGPLLDSAGRLVGVNTAIASTSGSSAGIGFAVPVDTVNQIVPQLIAHGRVVRPQLGVVLADDSISERLGSRGVIVLEVQPGSSAERAGLRGTERAEDGSILLGDVIRRAGKREVRTTGDLLDALEGQKAGDRLPLEVLRNGQVRTVEVLLGPGS